MANQRRGTGKVRLVIEFLKEATLLLQPLKIKIIKYWPVRRKALQLMESFWFPRSCRIIEIACTESISMTVDQGVMNKV